MKKRNLWFITAEWFEMPPQIVTGNGHPTQPTLHRKCGIINEHPAIHYAKQFTINQSYLINFACEIDYDTENELRAMGIDFGQKAKQVAEDKTANPLSN